MLLPRTLEQDLFGSINDMQRLQQQLNSIFHDSENLSEFPPVNVWTCADGAIVRTEVPGIDTENIDVSIVNETLTIRGTRAEETGKGSVSCHRKERDFGHFVRSLQLPFEVDGDRVKARFAEGVLEITLPRAEASKPRKIGVVSE